MAKTLIITEMVGSAASEILQREVNSLCVDKELDGTAIWKEITEAQHVLQIQEIIQKHFGDELKVV
jgi:hypothetical protein